MLRDLDWDTKFYDKKIGEVDYKSNVKYDLSPYHLIYLKSLEVVNPKFDGFVNSFDETKILFSKLLKAVDYDSDNIYELNDISYRVEELYELAFESGKYSRFNLDERFSRCDFERLYKAWIDNSISHVYADKIFVHIIDNKIVGFISCKITGAHFASIGLLAVSPDFQGRNIGTSLLKKMEYFLVQNSIINLYIPTQEINKGACDFYTKRGYSITETTYIKHYWKYDTI